MARPKRFSEVEMEEGCGGEEIGHPLDPTFEEEQEEIEQEFDDLLALIEG